MTWKLLAAFVVGVWLGLSWPGVSAQVVTRIYGTTSTGVIVPILVDADGKLQVVSE